MLFDEVLLLLFYHFPATAKLLFGWDGPTEDENERTLFELPGVDTRAGDGVVTLLAYGSGVKGFE